DRVIARALRLEALDEVTVDLLAADRRDVGQPVRLEPREHARVDCGLRFLARHYRQCSTTHGQVTSHGLVGPLKWQITASSGGCHGGTRPRSIALREVPT